MGEKHAAHDEVQHGEHNRSEKRRQESFHLKSRHEDRRQLQQEGIHDQPEQAESQYGQWKGQEMQRPSEQRIDDGDHDGGDQRDTIIPHIKPGNHAGHQPQGQGTEQPVYEQVHEGSPEFHNKPMARLFAGTSGFAYAQWKPQFYPAKLPATKFLEHYARHLNSVEINYSFRHTLTAKTIENWVAATPVGFVFALKGHQRITHIMRLK